MNPLSSRLALAADLPLPEAQRVWRAVRGQVGVAKVGLSLFVEHGPAAVRAFQEDGGRVFLDLKLHDIPNTVELAARRAGELGVAFLTVHASGGKGMLEAAARGAAEGAARAGHPAPKLLAVTVLTSMGEADLASVGHTHSAPELVLRLAQLAQQAGIDGLVCSPREVHGLRERFGPSLFLCTPGIRPAGAAQGDQTRAETPGFAIRAGSDLLVIGRPIYEAADPLLAAQGILRELSIS